MQQHHGIGEVGREVWLSQRGVKILLVAASPFPLLAIFDIMVGVDLSRDDIVLLSKPNYGGPCPILCIKQISIPFDVAHHSVLHF